MPRLRPHVLAPLLLAVLAWLPVLPGGFVYDERIAVAENPALFQAPPGRVLFTHDYFNLSQEATYRPVVTASYLLDHALWGLWAPGWRLTNLLLHLACVACLWLLLHQWAVSPYWASLGAAVFALHPLHVETVACVGFREDLLAALGMLLMALLLGRWIRTAEKGSGDAETRGRGEERAPRSCCSSDGSPTAFCPLVSAFDLLSSVLRRPPVLAFAAVFLAQMSKENAFMAPALALALAWADPWPGRPSGRSRLSKALPFLGAVALATGLSAAIRVGWMANDALPSPPPLEPGLVRRILLIPWVFTEHGLAPLIRPVSLRPDRLVDAAAIGPYKIMAGWFVALALTGSALWLARRRRRLSIGLFWYGLAWAPTSNLIPLIVPAAERFAYLPDLGLAMLLGLGAAELAGVLEGRLPRGDYRRRAAADLARLGSTLVFVALAVLTFRQAHRWKDIESLWSHTLECEPLSLRARHCLSVDQWRRFDEAKEAGDLSGATRHRQRAVSLALEALEIEPKDKSSLSNYGAMLLELGEYRAAEPIFLRIVKALPNDRIANHCLGVIYAKLRPPQPSKALRYLLQAREAGYPEDKALIERLREATAAGGQPSEPQIP
jgi:tetratricopeptide (TPR) repeat protein